MDREELLRDLVTVVSRHLDVLESRGSAGSVVATIHCDASGPRKVIVGLEETWPVRQKT